MAITIKASMTPSILLSINLKKVYDSIINNSVSAKNNIVYTIFIFFQKSNPGRNQGLNQKLPMKDIYQELFCLRFMLQI